MQHNMETYILIPCISRRVYTVMIKQKHQKHVHTTTWCHHEELQYHCELNWAKHDNQSQTKKHYFSIADITNPYQSDPWFCTLHQANHGTRPGPPQQDWTAGSSHEHFLNMDDVLHQCLAKITLCMMWQENNRKIPLRHKIPSISDLNALFLQMIVLCKGCFQGIINSMLSSSLKWQMYKACRWSDICLYNMSMLTYAVWMNFSA